MISIPDKNSKIIPALDGIRAIAVLIVAWYHIWQQSWLRPELSVPKFISRSGSVSLEFIPRSGYLFVDLLLLLSAFCLFLPFARAKIVGTPQPSIKSFYKNRLIRIIPPYYLAVIICFFVACFKGMYSNFGNAAKDFLSTLSFTQTFFPSVYLGTKINGVLWTAAIEMQFYLVFPLLAKAFQKKPLITYLSMVLTGSLYLRVFALGNADTLRITLNQMISFMGVFANGMAFAYLYIYLKNKTIPKWIQIPVPAIILILSVIGIIWVQKTASASSTVQIIQAQYRYILSLFFGLLVFSCAMGGKVIQFLFGNPLMHFLALISYNLYIWHQWIAVHLKEVRVPYWSGDKLPNMTGNVEWQNKYTLIVFFCAILIASAITFLYERPLTKLLKKN